jgi:hypothetical protein
MAKTLQTRYGSALASLSESRASLSTSIRLWDLQLQGNLLLVSE